MSFRKQLITGQVVSVLLTLVTGLVAVLALSVTARSASSINRELADDLALVEQVRLQTEQLVSAGRAYLLTGEPRYVERFERLQAQLERTFDALRARSVSSSRVLSTLEEHADDYVGAVTRTARERTTTGDPRTIVGAFETDIKPRRDAFEAAVSAFAGEQRAAFDAAAQRASERASRAQLVLVFATVLGVALGIGLGVVVMRKLESEYRRVQLAREEAARASETRKQLLAIVSHDLRGPLNTIVLGAATLEGLPPRHQHCADMIASAAERMTHLIDELIDVARLEGGRLELSVGTLEVRALLDLTAQMFEKQAGIRDIELRVACEVDTVVADRERVLRVLSNLVGNALKFSRDGTTLVIAAREVDDQVHFDVIDRGPGISAEDMSHLFDRGWRGEVGKERGLGLGLGLYICKALVEAHRGRIGVDSKLGEGSRFWFELPRRPSTVT